jgi:DNA (cytosine-5)-methyltransferase 1
MSSERLEFIDLFAGIGGIRLGFESIGAKCVFTSEWNEFANKTYKENFEDDHLIAGDITKISSEDIPEHDILLAGFPCQPFSIAGVSKKNSLGHETGFLDKTQGTLFFEVARILRDKRPKYFMLENVKNLLSHNNGQTYEIIRKTLEMELGYHVFSKVIDSQCWVPQHRERIIIVGFREETDFTWDSLIIPETRPVLKTILHPEDGSEIAENPYTSGNMAKVDDRYILSDNLWGYLQTYAEKHKRLGHGFGYGLVNSSMISRTLSARYYKDGAEILVSRGESKNPRRLTPRECARLMGFEESFKIVCSDTQAYRQFGNSVVVPVIKAVAQAMKKHMR